MPAAASMLLFGVILMGIVAFLRRALRQEEEKPDRAVADTLLGVTGSFGAN